MRCEEHGSLANLERASLSLDSVFFADGGFVGANRYHLWEQIIFPIEERKAISELARQLRNDGAAPQLILDKIQSLTGPAPGWNDQPMRIVPGRDHPRHIAWQRARSSRPASSSLNM